MHTVLIDDDFISVFLTEKLLKREGIGDAVRSFQSPQEAVGYLQQTLPAEIPELILLDLNMPLMNGWDVLEALKPYEEDLLPRCFIYILTSSLALADTARAKEFALVTGLIHKPLDKMHIQEIHARIVERRSNLA
ncbi:response regulator [Hymenobacter sp. GOD-10R]|uniref:response regulator n=1 Tax=Hymenobacter sp. GOD-10R TaxID=3093922 RepID=UPI002D78B7FB|nr:response regulator [Hymenobacter sp. GOD-10R]WRQ29352.1 response regulator [Hymenobacter sp. GOD-10R]